MTSRPASTIRVVWLVGGLMVRRFVNRITSRRKAKRDAESTRPGRSQPRTGTARKGPGAGAAFRMVLVGALFLFGAVFLASNLTARVAELGRRAASTDDRMWVSSWTYRQLGRSERALDLVRARRDRGANFQLDLEAERDEELRDLEVDLVERAGGIVDDPNDWGLGPGEAARIRAILERWTESGLDGFATTDRHHPPLTALDPLPEGEAAGFLIRGYALILAFVIVSQLLTAIGSTSRDLSRNEWSFEWLFSFPVASRGLFVAKWLGYTLVSVSVLMTTFPLLLTLLCGVGREWAGLGLALVGAVCVALMTAALRVAIETFLRLRMSSRWSNTVTALSSLLGILAFYAVFWVAIAQEVPEWFFDLVRATPEWVAYTPFGCTVLLAASEVPVTTSVAILVGWTVLVAALSIGWSSFAVRRGIERSAGPVGGNRSGAGHWRVTRWTDRIDKELVMLLRDRTLMVGTLFVPIVIIGFQILINPGWSAAAARNFSIAGMTAFAIGSYVALFAGQAVVNGEDKSFWLLFTFPQSLSRTLRRKVRLWVGVVWLYAIGAIVALGRFDGSLGHVSVVALVLAGTGVFMFIVVGLAVLGADPFQEQKRRRLKPETAYLMMILAAAFCWALRDADWWTRSAILVLFVMVATSVWQVVDDRVPYLLDPVAMPKARVGLVHGTVAVFLFFVLQSMLALAFHASGWSIEQARLLGFTISGGIIGFGTIVTLALRRVEYASATGLQRDRGAPPGRAGVSLLLGPIAGAVTGAAALGYIAACREFGWFEGQLGVPEDFEFLLLAIVAAPLVEEFLFRGLVFRGMRRSWSLIPSVLGSAALFAISHPPVSWLPVFVLGVVSALVFERSRILLGPVLVHAAYNAVVTLVAR